MLKQTIEERPADLWDGGPYPVPFWRVVYHTLYATHLYLQPTEQAFRPWRHHRDEYNDLPWPPGAGKKIDDPYTKAQMLDYWRLCDAMVDDAVNGLDLDAPGSGFSWHKTMPKLEHQIHNIRHIQHHAAILSARLRLADGTDIRWVRTDGEIYQG
jgi:hypothetical protein